MLTLAFAFPAGRYHGTPWGRHVNETDVGWPPDLWRLTRALIATWHRRLDQKDHTRECLAALLGSLAGEAPHYRLPDAVHFHTRHYMPVRDKPSLIFDAFAQVGREAELIVHWSKLDLDADQTRLLDDLLKVMGYLGRAESWVDARRLPGWSEECNCYPSQEAVDEETGEVHGDLVPLWLPRTAADYAGFRIHSQDALRSRGLPPREIRKVEATLPEDWLTAVSLDTGELQAAGWSAPPAARQEYYLRPKDALRFMAASAATAKPRDFQKVTTARFALYAKPLPPITDAVRVGEILRAAVMGCARRLLGENIPSSLSGHDLAQDNRHEHAFFLSERNSEGRISHVLVHAPGGLDGRAQAALSALTSIRTREGAEWRLLLEGLGDREHFPDSTLLRSAVRWRSVTPYLHPWHRKKGLDVSEQIARECRLRGLPEPVAVEPVFDAKPRVLEYRRFRSRRDLQQPDRLGQFLEVVFPEPVSGALALGFGCHFGLGVFGVTG